MPHKNKSSASRNKPRSRQAASSDGKSEIERVAGVKLTHPDRVVYPEQGITKLQLARYYEEIADWILPYIVDRPLSLVRCPRGRQESCFFQKHRRETFSDPVHSITVQEKDGPADYVAIDDLAGLVALVQFGTLEIHPWGAQGDRLDRPDVMVFDLDPDPQVRWQYVIAAAGEVREHLQSLDLECFLRTSGGKGLHVLVPLTRRNTWDEVKSFAKAIATGMQRSDPEKYIATASKEKRQGKVFIDYLRNDRGATAIACYSARAKPGAPVSTPMRWDELTEDLKADDYNVENIPARLDQLESDPRKGFFEANQSITKGRLKEVGK